ncbi:hypothetical protein [Xylophilus sp. GOD-11R]|uniref:hypothetical protein n=1 Tax=Xylophilus sp. GOD-11R TaxID=3089814 RepID=UPI00298C24F6|nr:hypothetical protein [Xylophilus sp. GOD-11R]WPB58096.1 hypothetical protein R9X41_05505 [Xylophilus sp. GOD-11R]
MQDEGAVATPQPQLLQHWRLAERVLLNPGSVGEPLCQVDLLPRPARRRTGRRARWSG